MRSNRGYIQDLPKLNLTAEQMKIQQELEDKQQEEWEQEEEERNQREAQQMADKITFVLDQVKAHPFIQDFFSLKSRPNYMRIALEALIQADPTMDAKKIAKKATDIANELDSIASANTSGLS